MHNSHTHTHTHIHTHAHTHTHARASTHHNATQNTHARMHVRVQATWSYSLNCAGSVAAIKVPNLCQELGEIGHVKVVSTESAQHFMTKSVPVPAGPGLEYLNVSHPGCNVEPHAFLCAKVHVCICLMRTSSSALVLPCCRTQMSGTSGGMWGMMFYT